MRRYLSLCVWVSSEKERKEIMNGREESLDAYRYHNGDGATHSARRLARSCKSAQEGELFAQRPERDDK